jgi:HEAT repeat protein
MARNKPMQDFNSLDFDIVAAGISRLRELSDPSAIPILANLLTSQDEDIKSIAIEALVDIAEIGDRIAGEALLTILSDPSSSVRDEASYALMDLDYKPAKNLMVNLLLEDPDRLVRVAAAESLAYLADKGEVTVIDALEKALDDPIEPVRSFSACSLGILGIPESRSVHKLEIYLTSEESLSTKAEIMGARCRLGIEEDLLKIFSLLDIAEEEDYFSILNAIQDLVSREIPASLHKNREYIIEALKQFGNKNRFHAHQINLIIDKIGELKTPAVKLKIPE